MLGLNLKVSIINNNYSADDVVGGAIITGTVTYTNIPARISPRRPTQAALEAGLEVERIFDMIVIGQGLNVNERDEVFVTWPTNHPFYNEHYRILGIQHDSRLPNIGHTEFTMARIDRSRVRQ